VKGKRDRALVTPLSSKAASQQSAPFGAEGSEVDGLDTADTGPQEEPHNPRAARRHGHTIASSSVP